MAARQWIDTTYENGGECGQNEGSQNQNAFHPPMPWSRPKCSGGDAGGWLVWQAYPAQLAKHESPCGIASAAAAWKWASESQNMAQVLVLVLLFFWIQVRWYELQHPFQVRFMQKA